MKTFSRQIATALLILLPAMATAQLELQLNLEQTSYLRYEPIQAKVTIRNQTDSMLLIGGLQGGAELEFDIRFDADTPLQRTSPGKIVSNVMIMPGESKTIGVNITDHFSMMKDGQYSIKVRIRTGNEQYLTQGTIIDIIPGIEIERMERALPSQPGTIRVYSLVYWTRDTADHLFLSVTDSKGQVSYGVYDLGRLIRFIKPVMTVDISGKITVVHQSDSNAMIHSYLQSVDEGVIFLKSSVQAAEESTAN